MRFTAAAFALGLLLTLSSAHAAPAPAPCTTDEDCASGERCQGGVCGGAPTRAPADCAVHDDCGPGGRCFWGVCLRGAGAACAVDEDCGDGLVCAGRACEWEPGTCAGDADCGRYQICFHPDCEGCETTRGWCLVDPVLVPVEPSCAELCADIVNCARPQGFVSSAPSPVPDDRQEACTKYCSYLATPDGPRVQVEALRTCVLELRRDGCTRTIEGCAQDADTLARSASRARVSVALSSAAGAAASGEAAVFGTYGDMLRAAFGILGRCVWGSVDCSGDWQSCPPEDNPGGSCWGSVVGPTDAGAGPAAALVLGLGLVVLVARRRWFVAGLLAVVLLPAAAQAETCAADDECGSDGVCALGVCRVGSGGACEADDVCAAGLVCAGCHCDDATATCRDDADCGEGLYCLRREAGLPGDTDGDAVEACAAVGSAVRGWCVVDKLAVEPTSVCEAFCLAQLACEPRAPSEDIGAARRQTCERYCAFLGDFPATAGAMGALRNRFGAQATLDCERARAEAALPAAGLADAAAGLLLGVRYDGGPVRMPVADLVREAFGIADGCVHGEGRCDASAFRCPRGNYMDTGCSGGGTTGRGSSVVVVLLVLMAALAIGRVRRTG